jgi:alpha-galactosidase
MIAPTPPMGWNSWNTFGPDIHEDLIRETADAFVTEGLKDAGYRYVVIDDFWEADERDAQGRLVADPEKFPSGIAALAEYVHSKGLKFGIYSCAGSFTCGGKPASYGYEEIDAQTFADWGVDFLKYDFCFHPAGANGPESYKRMGQALRSTGRPILFSLCEWGANKPWEWAQSVGGHMWRTTGDIADTWESMVDIGQRQKGLERYAGPDHWNDPDMLIVGMYGKGNVAHGGCTTSEYRFHFALWALLCSPLMIGCDVRNMKPETKEILLNPGLIAVNQDPMGRQANYLGTERGVDAWRKPMQDGSVVVGLFNRSDDCQQATFPWDVLGIHDRRRCRVEDVLSGEDRGHHDRTFATTVPTHDCRVFRLYPQPLS